MVTSSTKRKQYWNS